MELKYLQTFLTLSQIKNFTKTAEKLGYAQSNITAQIKQLENELGVPLFNRLGHRITLTSKGKELVPYAAKILSLTKEATTQISPLSKTRITIAAAESLCIYCLPQIIKNFRELYPETDIFIQMIDTDNFVHLLSENEADIAFTIEKHIANPCINHFIEHNEKIGLYSIP